MFSSEPRCLYRDNPLGEVICQLHFPEIVTIHTTLPDRFQDAIRKEFPKFSQQKEPSLPGTASAGVNYQFSSVDNLWRIHLTSRSISLSCSKYPSWEAFAARLDKPLAAFIQIYQPAYFDRVGLRYINFISRFDLGLEGVPFSQLISPSYLGLLGEEDILEHNCTRSGVDAEMNIRGGCRVKIHAGPGLIKRSGRQDPEVKFVIDQDLYMPGQIPVNLSVGALQTLHSQAYPIFRGAIADRLHDAFGPETI